MEKKYLQTFLLFIVLTFILSGTQKSLPQWGFFGHKKINRLAVFCLPPEMIRFYKHYITFITEEAVNPDSRRYAVEGEAERHFIDIDVYDKFFNDSAVYKMPRYWKQAVERFTEDTLKAYGIVPWHIEKMKHDLTRAFEQRDARRILRLSADLGHYIADGNVPLHTTENYNGQKNRTSGYSRLLGIAFARTFLTRLRPFCRKSRIYQKHPIACLGLCYQCSQSLGFGASL